MIGCKSHLAAATSAAALSFSIAIAGCGDRSPDEGAAPEKKQEIHKGGPIQTPRKPIMPLAGKRDGGPEAKRTELFSMRLESVSGDVKVRTRREEPERKAAKGDNLFAGARVVVGEGASAEATLREVGRLKIGESTEILVPTHGRCGAIVVRGSAHLEGTKMNRRRSRCYLHTSAASFWAPRAEAAVAAAPDGRARLIAITGGVSRVDVDDSAVEIAPATATTFEWNGEPGPSKAIDPVAMDAEEDLAKWLAGIGAMKPSDADERAGKMLDEADGIAALLEKDVSALESTAESIRTRRKEYMETAKDPATGEDRMADLKRALSHTTDEKLALLGRGAQKIHRIAALCAAAASIGSTDAAIAERAEALRGEVGALVPRAPRMFEKAHKGSSRNRILQRMSRYRPIKAD